MDKRPDPQASRRTPGPRRLARLAREYGMSLSELEGLLRERQAGVPVSLFATDVLTPLEAIIKYLREERGMRLFEIGALLGRDQREIGVAYRRVQQKMSGRLEAGPSEHIFPLVLLKDRRLSAFEHLVRHLQGLGLRYSEIATLTKRDQRTIWTVAKRAEEKLAAGR